MPFLDDLELLMVTAGVAVSGTSLFQSSKAAIPKLAAGAATITLVSTSGAPPEFIQNTKRPASLRPGALLVARADDWAEAQAMAIAAYDVCVNVRNQVIGSGFYRWIRPTQEPYDGGRDEGGQVKCAFNVLADYSRS